MVQRTSKLGLPWVEPVDTVTSYPTVSQELATDLETAIASRHVLRANRSAALSFSGTANAWAVIPMDSKLVDQSTAYSTGTGNYTCPVAGLYLVSGQVGANVTAIATTGVGVYKNGTGSRWAYATHGVASSGYTEPHCTLIESCNAGDTLALWGSCSIASQAIRAAETFLSIVYLGPL